MRELKRKEKRKKRRARIAWILERVAFIGAAALGLFAGAAYTKHEMEKEH